MTMNAASEPLHIALSRTASVEDASATEGSSAAVDFQVTLDAADDCETATVDWATADGTAVAGEDYTQANGTLAFEPGETTKTVSIAVLDYAANEGAETLTLRLINPSDGTFADDEATGTIVDDEVAAPVGAGGRRIRVEGARGAGRGPGQGRGNGPGAVIGGPVIGHGRRQDGIRASALRVDGWLRARP